MTRHIAVTLLSDFEWRVAPELYQVVMATPADAPPQKALWVPSGEDWGSIYRPLIKEPLLFWQFANLAADEAAILAFARQFGPLGMSTEAAFDFEVTRMTGQPVELLAATWNTQIRKVRHARDLWRALQNREFAQVARLVESPEGPLEARRQLRWEARQQERLERRRLVGSQQAQDQRKRRWLEHAALTSLASSLDSGLAGLVVPHVERDERAVRLHVSYRPHSLLGAIWLQLALAVDGNDLIRICACGCGRAFEVDRQMRSDTLYFGDACRAKTYRGRKRNAQRLAAEAVPLAEIARRLGTTITTVKRWIKEGAP